jgi:hypothetical protein
MDAEFRVYDAMLAVCKAAQEEGKPLPKCFAREYVLANMVDRSVEQVRQAMAKLEANRWITPTHDTARRRKRAGNYTTNEYCVLEHDEWAALHGPCPPLRYDPATGHPLKPGELSPGLARFNVRRIPDPTGFMASLPDFMADKVAAAIAAKKANTGNPVQAASTITGNPEIANTGNSVTADTGNSVTADTGNPVTAVTGNPVTSLKIEAGITSLPTSLNLRAPENESGAVDGGVAGWIRKNLATMGSPKGKPKDVLNALVAEHGENDVVQALDKFLNRPDGFQGIKHAWSLFISEASDHIGQVQSERRRKEAEDLSNRRAGERLKAETLAKLEGIIPPLSESERTFIQEHIAKMENGKLSGVDYFIRWQMIAETIHRELRCRRYVAEQESGGSIEDYL